MSGPRASVVMTVYNDVRFFDEAVESVLAQTSADLELVIVDDGADDKGAFAGLETRDPRIRLITNEANIGTAAAANRGIAAARADIIVRLDADDVAEPSRVARLVEALDADPELGLVGSAVTLINETGEVLGVQPMPETDLEIRWTIHFHNPFYHSAVAFRRSCFEAAGGYRTHELVSQDHYLWRDLLPHCRMQNLTTPLTRYRLNPQGLTAQNAHDNPRARTHPIREQLWAGLGLTYNLYDNALAGDVTQFLRGFDLPAPERREAAYAAILSVLDVFLKAPRPFARSEDAGVGERLRATLVDRMRAAPPSLDFAGWFADTELSTDWTSRFFETWAALLMPRRNEALDVLEIGSWEGRSAIFFLRCLPKCRLTCVDTFAGSSEHTLRDKWADALPNIESRFDRNTAAFGARVEKLKRTSSEALAQLAVGGRRYDLVFVDGSHHSADVRADAEGAWPLVRPGGIVIFDDYEWAFFPDEVDRPKLGVDAFLAAHAGGYCELHRGYQLIIQKNG